MEITGRVDRLERDAQGRGVIVDLKTGATAPRDEDLDRHPQLGVYQLAVLLGAFEELGITEPGGAELVQVGKAGFTARARVQRQRPLSDDPAPGWAKDLVDAVAAGMAGPVFRARVNAGLPDLPGRLLLSGAPGRRATRPMRRRRYRPVHLTGRRYHLWIT